MRSKLLVLLTVLALVLGTFATALAQDAPEVFCGDLSAEDCAILQQSDEAMKTVVQSTANQTLDVTVTGIPGLPAEEINATLTAAILSAADPAALDAAAALNGLSQEEMLQLLADDPQPLLDMVNGLDLDISAGLTMTPELAALISAQSGLDFPDTIAAQFKLVDGVLYWDLSEVAAFVPTVASGWVGYPLAEVAAEMEKQGLFDQALAAVNEQGMGAASLAGFAAPDFIRQNAELFQQYTTVERGEDVELAGQTGATFVTTFDAAAFLSGPEFQQIVVDLAKAGAFEGTGLSAADVEGNIQMLGMMGPMLFTGITATANQTIGLDDLYQYDYDSELSWDMAGLVQMAAASGALPAELQPTSDNVGFSVKMIVSNDNMSAEQTETVEAPANPAMIPLESVFSVSAD